MDEKVRSMNNPLVYVRHYLPEVKPLEVDEPAEDLSKMNPVWQNIKAFINFPPCFTRLSSYFPAKPLAIPKLFVYLHPKRFKQIQLMTTVELRTSIAAELDHMSVEMLESVSRYVSRLRRRARTTRRVSSVQDRREAAMLFVKNLSVQGGLPVPSDESGIDALVDEKYDK